MVYLNLNYIKEAIGDVRDAVDALPDGIVDSHYSVLYRVAEWELGINQYFNLTGTGSVPAETSQLLLDSSGSSNLYFVLMLTDEEYMQIDIEPYNLEYNYARPYDNVYSLNRIISVGGVLGFHHLLYYDSGNNYYAMSLEYGRLGEIRVKDGFKLSVFNPSTSEKHAYVYILYATKSSVIITAKSYENVNSQTADITAEIREKFGWGSSDFNVIAKYIIDENGSGYDYEVIVHRDIDDNTIREIKRILSKYTKVKMKEMGVIR